MLPHLLTGYGNCSVARISDQCGVQYLLPFMPPSSLALYSSCALYSGLIDSDDWNRYIIMGRLTPSLPVPGWLVKKVDQWSPHRKRTELRLYGTYNAVER
ncbi:hypothetical protein SCLCIDRAFT_1049017 [Scleroderma citrinum Foug A]|uniref:Uncharacterized protein n=1 Tax=Scleroderma citrinum Foug A TaxID=1036808 RepID=A0A0C3A2H8_9AGAM|nr:hypothetical protein SCLCIDRAFT_1049017 [Scleroderma citrinum Foug A]